MRDDGRTLTTDEWTAMWGQGEEELEGKSYVLPKIYPGPRIRCPNCGYWQGNEAVIDTYRWCMRCCTVLQDSATLYWDSPLGLGPFRVVAASYGHPRDPKLAISVRTQLQRRVGVSDRLVIRREESLIEWLGNPCPGVLKTLRIRYVSLEGVAKGRRREVWLQESVEGHLAEAVSLQVPTTLPLVVVFSAVYGSPGDPSRGRGKIDVTEFMQGRVDLADGKYLYMSRKEPLTDLFGDPCPGRDKCLVLRYEIVGTEGRAEAVESDGRLLTPISISCTPMLAPLILVESATYGQTREGIDERLQLVQRELSDLFALQNRKDMGMPLSRDENKRLMGLRPLIADLQYLKTVTPRYVDVRACLQGRVEEFGGGVLELVAAKIDANQLFGNPLPGKKKELRVRYLVAGHDSERLTSLEETTSSGYPRNFILQRKGQVVVQAWDDRMSRGVLENDVLVDSPKVLSVVEILTSSYGHPRNATKTYDISSKLRQMIEKQGGEKLVIDCKIDLVKLFDEPCRGVRKKIKITYIARGLNGMVRVNEIDQHLVADVIVGYYNRQNFRDSELLAGRHSVGSKSRSPANANRIMRKTDSSDGTNNSDPEEDLENGFLPAAAPDGLCFPASLDAGNRDLAPQLHLRTSTTPTAGSGEIVTQTLAEQRRERRREQRQAHQARLRQKEAERESERRRMRVDKARREREVARAVRDAEDTERVRLLREAQEAENAAPIAARLMRTMQRRAAGAVAAAKARAGAGAGVVAVAAGGVSTQQTMATGNPADDSPFGLELGEKNHQRTENAPDGDDLPTYRRPSQVRFDKEQLPIYGSNSREREDGPPAGDRKVSVALTNASKKGRQWPQRGAKARAHPPPEGEDGTKPETTTPPLSRAREKAATAASATDTAGAGEAGKLGSDKVAMSTHQVTGAMPQQPSGAGADTDLRRRKPSEERVGEPRAVFVHRASMVASSIDGAAAWEEAVGQTGGSVAEQEARASHVRRKSTKGRVGSVLPS